MGPIFQDGVFAVNLSFWRGSSVESFRHYPKTLLFWLLALQWNLQ